MNRLQFNDIMKRYENNNFTNKDLFQEVKEEVEKSNIKIVVLDDDPTGVQTVHDIYVYTNWSYDSILEGFIDENPLFFILTNSRSMTQDETIKVHKEIGQNIIKASKETGKKFMIICRGDSTLRGHYLLEPEILRKEIEKSLNINIDGEILIPFFQAGGRYTIENIHYVKYGDELVPASETEFAKDKTFAYNHSDLRLYIEEKTQGKIKKEEVVSVELNELREEKLSIIEEKLDSLSNYGKAIVNAIEPKDLQIFTIALYKVIEQGKTFLFRTAADFVKVVGGIPDKNLLRKKDMLQKNSSKGGIVVIGSHTAKTNKQLEILKKRKDLVFIEYDSDLVLEDKLEYETARVSKVSSQYINEGKTVVVYTKRKLLTLSNDTKEEALQRSVKISEGVYHIVKNLDTSPQFVIAKGGITSSDIGVKALEVRKAKVLGQILPGVPVWATDKKSRFPDIPYIIFPGNVGEDNSLLLAVKELID